MLIKPQMHNVLSTHQVKYQAIEQSLQIMSFYENKQQVFRVVWELLACCIFERILHLKYGEY